MGSLEKGCFTLSVFSSVAGGGEDEASHWPKKHAKYPVFNTFEANFAIKTKIASPPRQEDNWARTWFEFDQKNCT